MVAFATVVGSISAPARAEAFERQHHIGLSPTLAMLSVKDKSTMSIGGGGQLHYAYGLTDQFNVTAEAGYAVVAANQQQDSDLAPRNRPASIAHAGVGASYVIDITQWVPYFGLQVGGYELTGGTLPDPLFILGASVSLGLDYQVTRNFAVGVGARQHFLLTKLETYPSYTTGLLRFELMWGY